MALTVYVIPADHLTVGEKVTVPVAVVAPCKIINNNVQTPLDGLVMVIVQVAPPDGLSGSETFALALVAQGTVTAHVVPDPVTDGFWIVKLTAPL